MASRARGGVPRMQLGPTDNGTPAPPRPPPHPPATTTAQATPDNPRWIIFVTGPTACGKTTVAKYLAEQLPAKYLEGDDFHPQANIAKMHAGIPLTDADRATWLQAIEAHTRTYTPSNPAERDLVVTCSALKHEYRDTLRAGSAGRADDSRVGFLFLDAPEEVLRARAGRREGHFAGAGLVRSQFAVLERPVGEEGVVVVGVDRPLAEVEKRALDAVRGLMGR